MSEDQNAAPGQEATLNEWIDALAVAHLLISRGMHGQSVHVGEEWETALSRVAGRILTAHNRGRPRGEVPREWIQAVIRMGEVAPKSEDGMVAHASGQRIRVGDLPRAART